MQLTSHSITKYNGTKDSCYHCISSPFYQQWNIQHNPLQNSAHEKGAGRPKAARPEWVLLLKSDYSTTVRVPVRPPTSMVYSPAFRVTSI